MTHRPGETVDLIVSPGQARRRTGTLGRQPPYPAAW